MTYFQQIVKITSTCMLCVVLISCSDGGSSQPSAANLASVNAGTDQTVIEGRSFTLSAATYPQGGTVNWRQTFGPAVEGMPAEGSDTVDLDSPVVAVDTRLTFEAEYLSPNGQVTYDSVDVIIQNVNLAPIAIVSVVSDKLPPFDVYDVIRISAEQSYDDDGEIRQYEWSQVDANPPLKFLSDSNLSLIDIEGPLVTELTNYTIELRVTDNFGEVGVNQIDIQVAPSGRNIAADAGEDSVVQEYSIVTLDATNSISSVSDVLCVWTQLSGPVVSIADSNACLTQFVAPDVDANTELVFEVTARDINNNAESAQVTVTVVPVNLGTIQDTGVTRCFDDSNVITCGNQNYPMQDADTGRSSVDALLDKSGTGERGFDFTKLDVNGDELPDDALVFSCVRDNFTGLIWEVKQPATVPQHTALRGADNFYSFDDSQTAGASCPSTSDCGVETFVEEVNTATYCGGANWRLPTYQELLGIMDYSELDRGYLLDSTVFPNFADPVALGHLFHWISDTYAGGGGENFHWVLDLQTGDDSAIRNASPDFAYVILVRTP